MRTRLPPRNFRAGELAPWLDGLVTELTQQGARRLENFIVLKQGPIIRRPGTFYVAETKDSSAKSVLVPVEVDTDNIYVLEIGDAYIRFYQNHAQVSNGAGAAYEVTSPWSTGELADLRWAYVPADSALYFAHPEHAVRKLAWTSASSWTITNLPVWAIPPMVVAGPKGRTMRSSDGENWEYGRIQFGSTVPGYPVLQSIARGRDNYIAVSNDGGIDISTDGLLWGAIVPHVLGAATNYNTVRASRVGEAIAIANTSSGIYASYNDGLSWTKRTVTNISTGWFAVGYDHDNHRWRAIGYAGPCYAAHSSDGESWTTIAETITDRPYQIGYLNDLWVVACDNGISTATSIADPFSLQTSLGGVRAFTVAGGTVSGVDTWVVQTGTDLRRSVDSGATWSTVFSFAGSVTHAGQLIWARHRFYFFQYDNTDYFVSDDGQSWTTHTLASNYVSHPYVGAISSPLNDDEWFDSADHHPRAIGYQEGRLLLAGSNAEPAAIWGSGINDLNNFYPGPFAGDSWSYSLVGDRNVDIQWIMGGFGGLVVGTRTAEGMLLGSPEEGITPATGRFVWQSTFGSAAVQPVRVHDHIIFAQRGGEIIRGFVPGAGAQAYQSPDLTAFADHIAEGGITEIDHQDDPQTIVWFTRGDGQLLAFTFEQPTQAWARIITGETTTSGLFESAAIIPTSGAEDELWVVVNRTVDGATKRYVEYFDTLKVASKEDAHYVDCGVEVTGAGIATVSVGHLANETVDALIDGNYVDKGLVATSLGLVTLTTSAGSHVHVGLRYISYAQSMRMDAGSRYGSGMGTSKRFGGKLLAWVHNTIGGEYGPAISTTEAVTYTTGTDLTTDLLEVNFPGQWDRDGYLWVIQQEPLPMTLVGYAPEVISGD